MKVWVKYNENLCLTNIVSILQEMYYIIEM
jgi:hypothetical protein